MAQEAMYSKDLIEKRSNEIVKELQSKGISGIERFVKRLKIAPYDEEHLDILAQGRFALILNNNGFSCINMEPLKKGPDIMITSGESIFYCEIKRRRHKKEDYDVAKSKGAWCISPDSDDNVKDIIVNKLGQLLDGEINIVVIWSNTIKVGRPEIEEISKYISEEIRNSEGTYKNLSGIILVQDEKVDLRLPLPDEIHLFINEKATMLLPKLLIEKLHSFCRCVYSIQQFSA